MHDYLSDRARGHFYIFSILLSAMVVRILVGLVRPTLGFDHSVLVGLTTVVFLAPALYRFFFGEELLDNTRKRIAHGASMVLSAGLFVYYVGLAA